MPTLDIDEIKNLIRCHEEESIFVVQSPGRGSTWDELTDETLSLLQDTEVIKLIGSDRAPLATRIVNEKLTIHELAHLVGHVNQAKFRDVPIGQLLMVGYGYDVAQHGEPATYAHLIYSPLGFLDQGSPVLGDFSILDAERQR